MPTLYSYELVHLLHQNTEHLQFFSHLYIELLSIYDSFLIHNCYTQSIARAASICRFRARRIIEILSFSVKSQSQGVGMGFQPHLRTRRITTCLNSFFLVGFQA
jgi:hypothetical protein